MVKITLIFLIYSPFEERRKILQDNIKEIPGRIMLSEYTFVQVK